ncbi:hypothetical protein ACP275_14G021700 [Erythranthe tilingii]
MLTEEQILEFQSAFNVFDKDGDGCINIEELGIVMRSLDQNPTEKELRDMINEVDSDGNGTIDFDEFLNLMVAKEKMQAKDVLNEAQSVEFQEAFTQFDKDGDGCITIDDLARMMRCLDQIIPTQKELRDIINEIDSNRNGTIEFDEFLNHMAKNLKKIDADNELKEAFKVFDKDQNGYISANELRQTMINLGEKLTVEEVEQMVREADLNGDGQISFDEFVKTMATATN